MLNHFVTPPLYPRPSPGQGFLFLLDFLAVRRLKNPTKIVFWGCLKRKFRQPQMSAQSHILIKKTQK